MPASVSGAVGRRIASKRLARRMTQRDLAASARVSLSMLRKIEQGSRTPSEGVVLSIASALDVDPAALVMTSAVTDSRVHAAIPELRAVIDAYDLPVDGRTDSFPQLHASVEEIVRLRLSSHYARLVETLPSLIAELTCAVHSVTEAERQKVSALLVAAYRCADSVAFKYGYHDLSARLIELMRWAAAQADDELLTASTAYVRTETFFANNNLGLGLRSLHVASDALRSPTTGAARATLGSLHMRAAVLASRAQDRGVATTHLREARKLAETVPEGVYRGTAFGLSSLRIHELSVAVELGDGPAALLTTRGWRPPQQLPAERRSHYYIELARAQLWLGLRDETFESLQLARRIAPQHAREHPRVRETLGKLVLMHRRPPEALIRHAEWAKAI